MIKIKHVGVGKGQFFLIVVFVKAVLNFKQLLELTVCLREKITAHLGEDDDGWN
jgi:hypothetical protein